MNMRSISSLANKSDSVHSGTFKIQLTSLVDVMVILLVFLIKSFSSDVIAITPDPNIKLPVSTTKEPAPVMPSIQVTRDNLLAEGEMLVPVSKLVKSSSFDIPPLSSWLKKHSSQLKASDDKKLMIQSDKDVEFNVIKRVMYTCSKEGYSDFTILVLNDE